MLAYAFFAFWRLLAEQQAGLQYFCCPTCFTSCCVSISCEKPICSPRPTLRQGKRQASYGPYLLDYLSFCHTRPAVHLAQGSHVLAEHCGQQVGGVVAERNPLPFAFCQLPLLQPFGLTAASSFAPFSPKQNTPFAAAKYLRWRQPKGVNSLKCGRVGQPQGTRIFSGVPGIFSQPCKP